MLKLEVETIIANMNTCRKLFCSIHAPRFGIVDTCALN